MTDQATLIGNDSPVGVQLGQVITLLGVMREDIAEIKAALNRKADQRELDALRLEARTAVEGLRAEVEKLKEFKWKLAGGVIVISAAVSIAIEVFKR